MKGERGYTLVELIVASAIAATILSLLSAATYQFVTATGSGHDRLAVLHDQASAFGWLHRDAQMAVPADATVLPASVTLAWTDEVTGAGYESAYSLSGDDLVRTLSVDGAPTSQTVARNVAAAGFSPSLSGDLLTISLTSELGDATNTLTESFQLRPIGAVAASPPLRLATGSYAGNGVNGRAITGAGFLPDVVIVKADAGRAGMMRTSTMTGDATKNLANAGALVTNRIESLDADGFTVGSNQDVNSSGNTYYWVAMKAGSDLVVGYYVGDAADDRSITGVGFQPDRVVTLGDGDAAIFRPGAASGDTSYTMVGAGNLANRIQAFESDGFQVGSNNDVNENGTTYHYVAWDASPQVVEASYTGNGSDDRSITGVGFQPEFVWAKRNGGNNSVWRPEPLAGDSTLRFRATAAVNNRIQALEADGFQVGNNNDVNQNTQTYYYLALRDGGP